MTRRSFEYNWFITFILSNSISYLQNDIITKNHSNSFVLAIIDGYWYLTVSNASGRTKLQNLKLS